MLSIRKQHLNHVGTNLSVNYFAINHQVSEAGIVNACECNRTAMFLWCEQEHLYDSGFTRYIRA